MAIERLNKTFVDGEVWDSTDINPITSKIDECIDQINLNTDEIETARDGETDLNTRINRDLETNSTYRDEAYKWANEDEDTQVTDSANHSGYSAYHYSKKAEASANAAAQSESNAATSESNAAQSESDALAHLNEFKGIYYGSYAEDPETDPNGNSPDAGDYYWNTTRNVHRVYNGSGWEDALSSANNVSYDNTNSGLSATNVQDAVDEVESRVEDIESGTTTVPNADKVDNFHASQNPVGGQIPVLNSSGQLPLPFIQIPILVGGQSYTYRIFYVDSVNGSDNNPGTNTEPFATINKACDSVPEGGVGYINIQGTFDITNNIVLRNKLIDLVAWDVNNYPTINVTSYVSGDYNRLYSFVLYCSKLVLRKCNVNLPTKADTDLSWSGDNGFVRFTGWFMGGWNAFLGESLTVDLNTDSVHLCRTNGGYGAVYLSNSDITTNSSGYCYYISSALGGMYFEYNCTLDNNDYRVSGIIKDGNGVPRNLISNVVF